MTIAEFDKLHDMLKCIHAENIAILTELYKPKNGRDWLPLHQFDVAFEHAEKGKLQKWINDGEKLFE